MENDVISIFFYLPAAPAQNSREFVAIAMAMSNDIRLMTSGVLVPSAGIAGAALTALEAAGHPLEKMGVPHWFMGAR